MKYEIFKTDVNKAKNYFDNVLNKPDIRQESEILESYRSEFSRDRDRILFSTAFRRLSGKTQVFIAGFDAHVRTRLTHTLEVAQISRSIAKGLELNDMLCEAISLGHDIGHAPFGHVGEKIINCIMNNCYDVKDYGVYLAKNEKGFKHNFQSARILNELEWSNRGDFGLNLTYFTLWGILYHTDIKNKFCEYKKDGNYCSMKGTFEECQNKDTISLEFYNDYLHSKDIQKAWSIEALIVKWADEIAQRHHDIEDGLIARIIEPHEINKELKKIDSKIGTTYNKYFQLIEKELDRDRNILAICSNYSKIIVDAYVAKYIKDIKLILSEIASDLSIKNQDDFWKKRDEIYSNPNFEKIMKYDKNFSKDLDFKKYLQNKIINSEDVQIMNMKGIYILHNLFKDYLKNPQALPDSTIHALFRNIINSSYDLLDMKMIKDMPTKKIWEKRKIIKEKLIKEGKKDFLKILKRTICDQISYMTDEFALKQFNKLFESESVKNF